MDDAKPAHALIAAAALLCVGAALLIPRLLGTPESRREAEVGAAVKVINLAVWRYAQSHRGEYPETEDVTGGDSRDDVLLKEGYLVRYPPNTISGSGSAMRNAAGRGFLAGDFVYARKSGSKFEYSLFGWGAEEGRKVGMTGSGGK